MTIQWNFLIVTPKSGCNISMKISCIIPTKDRCDMVLRAIDSALSQQTDVHEVIVVDDGSVDGTSEVVQKRYPDVELVRLSGLGQGLARNIGVKASQGDVLMFLDSDDVWLPNHVEDLSDVVNQGFFVAYGTTRTNDTVNGDSFLIPDNGEGPAGDCFSKLVRWCFLVPSAMAVRRDAFNEVGGFRSGDLAEDWAFFLQLAKRFPFGFAGSDPITTRFLHNRSLCCLSDKKTLVSALCLVEDVLQDLGADKEESAWIACMKQWTQKKEENWNTIQEWYTAMKKEGML